MMKVFEVKQECKDCGGTGLYPGGFEHDGAAVVCYTCEGIGGHVFRHDYEEFSGRKDAQVEIKRVFQANPGIGIGEDAKKGLTLEDFGGMPYHDWLAGKPFPAGSEMRRFACPAWWYQRVDYKKKPDWKECLGCGFFSGCKHFGSKEVCWARWDEEQANKKKGA